jgi:hypothetical protein
LYYIANDYGYDYLEDDAVEDRFALPEVSFSVVTDDEESHLSLDTAQVEKNVRVRKIFSETWLYECIESSHNSVDGLEI